MDAVEKSIERKARKMARKKVKEVKPMPYGMGMGWPELHDRSEPKPGDDDYPTHDGKKWAIV